jgi:hypothetical protein
MASDVPIDVVDVIRLYREGLELNLLGPTCGLELTDGSLWDIRKAFTSVTLCEDVNLGHDVTIPRAIDLLVSGGR